jgi:hypothetical protein
MILSKQKLFLRTLAITVFLGLVLAACSPKDQLLGVWSEQGGDLLIRFHTGNFMSQQAYFGEDTLSLTGTYEIISDRQLRIEFQDGEWRGIKSGLYDYSIDRDVLQLNDRTFVRQPDVFNLEQ